VAGVQGAHTHAGSAPAGSSSPWPHTRQEAETEDIVHALPSHGVLARARLLDICGAAHWSDSGADQAVAHARSSGRIRQVGDDLYQTAEQPIR
jgi:hypothetical protein